jgi:hypothetical protein
VHLYTKKTFEENFSIKLDLGIATNKIVEWI